MSQCSTNITIKNSINEKKKRAVDFRAGADG
jgi:hypothetical protein